MYSNDETSLIAVINKMQIWKITKMEEKIAE